MFVSTTTRTLSMAAAAAIGSAGLLVLAPQASAACEKYQYNDNHFFLNQDNGIYVAMYVSGDQFEGPASYTVPGKPDVMGDVTGVRAGDVVSITVKWENGFSNTYSGTIRNDGTVGGTTMNNQGTTNSWEATGRFNCVAAPPPVQQQAPKNDPTPAAQDEFPASITSDVDVYEASGGSGEPYGMVPAGSKVKVVVRNPDNWVRVAGPAVPGEAGWVWGDFVAGG
jgi:hypothetical protein